MALKAEVEYLKSECEFLKKELCREKILHFRLDKIKHDNGLVRFYTGFISYEVLLNFFGFLGPVVDHLQYWGARECAGARKRRRILTPLNQYYCF